MTSRRTRNTPMTRRDLDECYAAVDRLDPLAREQLGKSVLDCDADDLKHLLRQVIHAAPSDGPADE